MTRDNIIPLHRGIITPAESAFDRDLCAERDRLAAEYRRRCAELDYPVEPGPRLDAFVDDSESIDDAEAGWAALLAFWLLLAFGFGMFLGSVLTVVAALLIDFGQHVAGWL